MPSQSVPGKIQTRRVQDRTNKLIGWVEFVRSVPVWLPILKGRGCESLRHMLQRRSSHCSTIAEGRPADRNDRPAYPDRPSVPAPAPAPAPAPPPAPAHAAWSPGAAPFPRCSSRLPRPSSHAFRFARQRAHPKQRELRPTARPSRSSGSGSAEAVQRPKPADGSSRGSPTLYMRGLPPDCTEREVKACLGRVQVGRLLSSGLWNGLRRLV